MSTNARHCSGLDEQEKHQMHIIPRMPVNERRVVRDLLSRIVGKADSRQSRSINSRLSSARTRDKTEKKGDAPFLCFLPGAGQL